jgi:hypothetical protein
MNSGVNDQTHHHRILSFISIDIFQEFLSEEDKFPVSIFFFAVAFVFQTDIMKMKRHLR